MDSDLQARLGDVLAPAYEVEGELGRGGMAIVYRARDTRLKRPVAIKLLPPELAFRGDIRSRFMREAETAARLNHPNIVPIYSVDEREGMVYFVMALIQGESVGDRVRRSGPLPIAEARRILREVADALAYAHANGVVHRDIKPDNVLLDAASGRAMVTDFGIARAASDDDGGARLTATGAVVGTPSYMSPEQCAGDREIDGRSDLYSLGAVAYQMLTGEPPFIGGNAPSVMMKQVTEAAVPVRQRRGDVPEDLERIVMRLLAKAPGDRFADGTALVAALDGAPVTPAPSPRWVAPQIRDELVSRALGRFQSAEAMKKAVKHLEQFPEQYREKLILDVQDRLLSRREERHLRRAKKRGEDRPLPERLRRFRGRIVGYAGTSLFMFGINYMTMGPGHHFWWFVFPVFGIGLGITREMGRLLGDGVPLGSIFGGTLPPELAVAAVAPGAIVPNPLPPLAASANDEVRKGPYGPVLIQAMADRQTVNDLFGRLTDTERKMLPDVKETADALFARVVALASALQRLGAEVGAERLTALNGRIAEIEQQPGEATERERRLNLLRRQRDMLAELVRSKATLLEQYESAGLLLQNLALDLLKVRSSGLDSAINGLTSATQEARALSREIGYVLHAADELRNISKS
jgi:serine/threonine-protein kinase